MKEPTQPEEALTSKPVSNGSNSESGISSVVVCQEESSSVLSASLQGKTAAVTNAVNVGEASQDVLPGTNPSMSQKDALLLNQDSVLMELDNSLCSNTVGATKLMHARVMKAVKDVPAPKLCSHTEWEESQVVSPVEELQNRLVKHASIVIPEVVEDSGKINVVRISKNNFMGCGATFTEWHYMCPQVIEKIHHFGLFHVAML